MDLFPLVVTNLADFLSKSPSTSKIKALNLPSDYPSLSSSSALEALTASKISLSFPITVFNLASLNLVDIWTKASIGWFLGILAKAASISFWDFWTKDPPATISSKSGMMVSKALIALVSLSYLFLKFSTSCFLVSMIIFFLSLKRLISPVIAVMVLSKALISPFN